jgi:hypothetical protein
MNPCALLIFVLLFVHVHGENGHGVNRCGGSPPAAIPVEAPVGVETWQR